MKTDIQDLIAWYERHCDGEWEHQHGFEISTLDNPGVRLRVDLNYTELSNKPFATVNRDIDSPDAWLHCEKTDEGVFDACGAPRMLEDIIRLFLEWAEESAASSD